MFTQSVQQRFLSAMKVSTGFLLLSSLSAVCLAVNAVDYDIPQQSLEDALEQFSRQSDAQIIYSSEHVLGKTNPAIKGDYNEQEALDILLKGTGLTHTVDKNHVIVIHMADSRLTQNGQNPASSTDRKANKGQETSDSTYIEEVIVTATKREQSIQDISMSITALGNEEINRRGLADMGDYLNAVPGVSFINQSAIQKQIVIRGLASYPQEEGYFGSLVGVYFGEIPIQGLVNSNNPDIKLVDMQRVEVLRGPQGTLYGSSNLSGTVRNIPMQPNLQELEGSVKASYSGTTRLGNANSELQGVVNIPLVEDEFAVRAVAYRFDNSGYYKNIGPSDPGIAAAVATYGALASERDDIGNDETAGARISALWQPSEKLSVNLSFLRQISEQDGWPSADLNLGSGVYLRGRLDRLPEGTPDFYKDPSFDNEGFENDTQIANGVIEYDFGWASLLSSTSWVDGDGKSYRELGATFFGGVPVGQFIIFDSKAFIQELRLTSQNEGPFQYVVGLYYSDIEGAGELSYSYSGSDAASNPFGETILFHGGSNQTTKEKAAFGEVTYSLSNQVALTAGARAFTYNREYTSISIDGAFVAPGGTIEIVSANQSDVSLKAAIGYTPNDDTLLYTSWSQGFRLGRALESRVSAVCDTDGDGIVDGSDGITVGASQLDSDTVDSYELGGKFTLLDHRLQVNAAIFQIDWDKIPANMFYGACSVQVNAGKARAQGAEFEATYGLSTSLLLNVGASYITAELSEDAGALGDKGDRLPGSPEYNFNLGLQYEYSLAGYDSFIRTDYYYVGGFYNNLQETGFEVGKYGVWNTRAGMQFGPTSVEVFANNITNEDAVTWIDTQPGKIASRLRPRTIGINIGYRF